ncbi:MAG: hypothetical protein WC513_09710, partial [Bacteroidales bacterium]
KRFHDVSRVTLPSELQGRDIALFEVISLGDSLGIAPETKLWKVLDRKNNPFTIRAEIGDTELRQRLIDSNGIWENKWRIDILKPQVRSLRVEGLDGSFAVPFMPNTSVEFSETTEGIQEVLPPNTTIAGISSIEFAPAEGDSLPATVFTIGANPIVFGTRTYGSGETVKWINDESNVLEVTENDKPAEVIFVPSQLPDTDKGMIWEIENVGTLRVEGPDGALTLDGDNLTHNNEKVTLREISQDPGKPTILEVSTRKGMFRLSLSREEDVLTGKIHRYGHAIPAKDGQVKLGEETLTLRVRNNKLRVQQQDGQEVARVALKNARKVRIGGKKHKVVDIDFEGNGYDALRILIDRANSIRVSPRLKAEEVEVDPVNIFRIHNVKGTNGLERNLWLSEKDLSQQGRPIVQKTEGSDGDEVVILNTTSENGETKLGIQPAKIVANPLSMDFMDRLRKRAVQEAQSEEAGLAEDGQPAATERPDLADLLREPGDEGAESPDLANILREIEAEEAREKAEPEDVPAATSAQPAAAPDSLPRPRINPAMPLEAGAAIGMAIEWLGKAAVWGARRIISAFNKETIVTTNKTTSLTFKGSSPVASTSNPDAQPLNENIPGAQPAPMAMPVAPFIPNRLPQPLLPLDGNNSVTAPVTMQGLSALKESFGNTPALSAMANRGIDLSKETKVAADRNQAKRTEYGSVGMFASGVPLASANATLPGSVGEIEGSEPDKTDNDSSDTDRKSPDSESSLASAQATTPGVLDETSEPAASNSNNRAAAKAKGGSATSAGNGNGASGAVKKIDLLNVILSLLSRVSDFVRGKKPASDYNANGLAPPARNNAGIFAFIYLPATFFALVVNYAKDSNNPGLIIILSLVLVLGVISAKLLLNPILNNLQKSQVAIRRGSVASTTSLGASSATVDRVQSTENREQRRVTNNKTSVAISGVDAADKGGLSWFIAELQLLISGILWLTTKALSLPARGMKGTKSTILSSTHRPEGFLSRSIAILKRLAANGQNTLERAQSNPMGYSRRIASRISTSPAKRVRGVAMSTGHRLPVTNTERVRGRTLKVTSHKSRVASLIRIPFEANFDALRHILQKFLPRPAVIRIIAWLWKHKSNNPNWIGRVIKKRLNDDLHKAVSRKGVRGRAIIEALMAPFKGLKERIEAHLRRMEMEEAPDMDSLTAKLERLRRMKERENSEKKISIIERRISIIENTLKEYDTRLSKLSELSPSNSDWARYTIMTRLSGWLKAYLRSYNEMPAASRIKARFNNIVAEYIGHEQAEYRKTKEYKETRRDLNPRLIINPKTISELSKWVTDFADRYAATELKIKTSRKTSRLPKLRFATAA